jgi:hypothetical protein
MSISTETLIAYVDGELSDDERTAFETAMAADETLRFRVERERKLRQRLSAAFDSTLTEAVPQRLARAATTPTTASNNVVALTPKIRAWTYREWGAMAASLIGGLFLGFNMMNHPASTLATTSNGLVARGALARALDTQTAANTHSAVHIGISFQARDGGYCRTFGVAGDHVAGLACKRGDEWRVPMTAQFTASPGELHTAGSDTPPSILQAIDETIAGDPLDARAERAALERHWRNTP